MVDCHTIQSALCSWNRCNACCLPSFPCRAFYDREPAITLRKYASYLVAEVTIEGKENMRDALSDGFRQVWPHRKLLKPPFIHCQKFLLGHTSPCSS